MADASFVQGNFLGGEWAPSAQGRYDLPAYRTAMNVCLNSLPIEAGAWTRRPGTMFMQTTRGGQPGRIVDFSFAPTAPYKIEFTDGFIRFNNGQQLLTTNDDQVVVAISTANPAVIQTTTAHGWSTGNSIFLHNLGTSDPLLQNRVFLATVVDTTHVSIADAITGATIDGSTLGTFTSGSVSRVLELSSPYAAQQWASPLLRVVACDVPLVANGTMPGTVLLNGATVPYVMQVTAEPTPTTFATFSLNPIVFNDGPYLDPVPGGTLITPNAVQGIVTLTLSFNAYNASYAYSAGDYVTSSSVNYRSLVNGNVGNTPVSSPSQWTPVSGTNAFNPTGFNQGDVGRLIRLFSEPAIWASGTSYVTGNSVAYGGTGLAAVGATYWTAIANGTFYQPNLYPTQWQLDPSKGQWTWGRIVSLSNIISGTLSGSTNIGNMTGGGGSSAAFDGVLSKIASAGAAGSDSGGSFGPGFGGTEHWYIGKNYSGASNQAIKQVTVYPSTDDALFLLQVQFNGTYYNNILAYGVTLNLRAKASAPSSSSDGTLLGTSGQITNVPGPITIVSNDQVTTWPYVWVEMVVPWSNQTPNFYTAWNATSAIAQVSFFNPSGSGTSQGVNVQIAGPALLSTATIRTWRLGVFGAGRGYPTCGTFHEGRLWLSGVVDNRIDGSGATGDIFNFSPTDVNGNVLASNAIAYTFNAPDVNPILAMTPDQQGIICNTQAGEWLVQASALNQPLTPTSIQAHRVTKIGGANIEPVRTDHTLVFVQRYQRKLMEYFPDVFSGKFQAPNLSKYAKHLMVAGIQEVAYQQELTPIIWARMGDGSLNGCTYQRETLMSSQGPTFMGWHRHTLGSGRVVESICAGPVAPGFISTLTMVTNDPATNIRHIEVMAPLPDDNLALPNAWHLDDALVPTMTQNVTIGGVSNFQMNGLWHLNGKTVQAFAGGLYLGTYTVANGALNVPFGGDPLGQFTSAFVSGYPGTMPIVVGFGYNSDGQLLRAMSPQESGARNGPAFGKKRRTHNYAIQFVNAAGCAVNDVTQVGLQVGTQFSALRSVLFTTSPDGGNRLPATSLKNGLHTTSLQDDNGFDSMFCWRANGPFPATVTMAGQFLHTEDK